MKKSVLFTLVALLLVVTAVGYSAPTAGGNADAARQQLLEAHPPAAGTAPAVPVTDPGLFFTIFNACSKPVVGFAVGDKLCFLQIGGATFTRGIFQGTFAAGERKQVMACAAGDGNATVLFVPPLSSPAQAVQMTVKPNETTRVPQTFCP
jgi:hypothetical protein